MFHNTTAAMGRDLMYSRREDVMNTSEFWASNSLASFLFFYPILQNTGILWDKTYYEDTIEKRSWVKSRNLYIVGKPTCGHSGKTLVTIYLMILWVIHPSLTKHVSWPSTVFSPFQHSQAFYFNNRFQLTNFSP